MLIAAQAGRIDVVAQLVEAGGEVNALPDLNTVNENVRYRAEWGTPLHGAAGRGWTGIIRYLLSKGASPYIRNYTGLTPKQVAEQSRHEECAKLLK